MKGTKVVGYIRVSTDEQGDSGAGLEAQRAAIAAEAKRRGWHLVEILEDTASGKTMTRRPGLAAALQRLESGAADALAVAKLDRLSRSLLDFAGLVERSRKQGWQLVALDLGVDTTTPAGEMMANVLAAFAQFERRLISQRTSDALKVKARPGRPPRPAPHSLHKRPAYPPGAAKWPHARRHRRRPQPRRRADRPGRRPMVAAHGQQDPRRRLTPSCPWLHPPPCRCGCPSEYADSFGPPQGDGCR